ncbi:MAG TPA: hypothetical protein VL069_15475 [Opitutus sp.]|nr:hypothetical protein [Opitutus sp.]
MSRPKGSKGTFVEEGLPLRENESRALWGAEKDLKLGGAWAHQLWITRHPLGWSLEQRANAQKTTVDEVKQQALDAPLPEWAVEWLQNAIDSRDWRFFQDAARMVKKIEADSRITPHNEQHFALGLYLDFELQKEPTRKFTATELFEKVDWSRTACPEHKQLGRLVKLFGGKRVSPKQAGWTFPEFFADSKMSKG